MKRSKKIYLFYTANSKLYPHFPSPSLALSAPLAKAGYTPVIIDTEMMDWRNRDYSDALFFGISTYTGVWLNNALEVATHLRSTFPDAPIFWGGSHAIALPESTIRHPLADVVCYSEGEKAIVGLAHEVHNGTHDYSKINGIMYKDRDGNIIRNDPAERIDLDDIEFPRYDLLDLNIYPIKQGRVYYQSSRGCVFKCKFCVCERGMKWRGRSAEKVMEDLEKINSAFSPQEVQFFDGNFFVDMKRVKTILKNKIQKKLDFTWSAFCRFDTFCRMDDETVQLLADSGCRELKLGGESVSHKILKYINKAVNEDKDVIQDILLPSIERCTSRNINPTISFMTGFPIETDEDLEETVAFIDLLRKKHPQVDFNGLFMLQHLPGSLMTHEILSTYSIPRPETLEDWARHDPVWTKHKDYPWFTRKQYTLRRTLSSITSYIYIANTVLSMPKAQRDGTVLKYAPVFFSVKLAHKIVKLFITLRWHKRFMFFPFEWTLWDLIRRYVLKVY